MWLQFVQNWENGGGQSYQRFDNLLSELATAKLWT